MTTRKRRTGAPSPRPHQAAITRLAAPPGFRFRPPADRYGVPVEGTCMEPLIFEGDIVVIEPRVAPEPGHVVVFEHVENGMLVKRLVQEGDGLALVALNDPTIHYPVDGRVNIVGVVAAINITLPDPHIAERRRAAELGSRQD